MKFLLLAELIGAAIIAILAAWYIVTLNRALLNVEAKGDDLFLALEGEDDLPLLAQETPMQVSCSSAPEEPELVVLAVN
jgi:hypothetical protein